MTSEAFNKNTQQKNSDDYLILGFIRADQTFGYNQIDYYDDHFRNIMSGFEKYYQKFYPIHNSLEERIMDEFLTGAAHQTAQHLADIALRDCPNDAIPKKLNSTISHQYFGRNVTIEQMTKWNDDQDPNLDSPSSAL